MIGILVSGSVISQNLTFSDWDNDEDGKIERHEFVDNFTDYHYTDIDVTNDYGLDDEDFYHYTYDYMDEDGDGLVNDDEWVLAYDYFLDDYVVYDEVVYYDLNNDGYISYDEYHDVVYETDWYSLWDLDNDLYLDEYELAYAVFDTWDINETGTLSKGEYAAFDSFYMDI